MGGAEAAAVASGPAKAAGGLAPADLCRSAVEGRAPTEAEMRAAVLADPFICTKRLIAIMAVKSLPKDQQVFLSLKERK